MGNRNLFVAAALVAIGVGCSSPGPVQTCPGGSTDCGGVCVDVSSDEANCGACGVACNYGSSCLAGACGVFGQPAQLNGATTFGANFLLGTAIDVVRPGTLRTFGILAPPAAAGSQVRMGLYTNVAGNPGALVAATAAQTLTGGRQEFPAAATLAAGRYWLMAVYNVGTAGYRANPLVDTTKYASQAFTAPFPATFPAATTYTDGPYNYYIVMSD